MCRRVVSIGLVLLLVFVILVIIGSLLPPSAGLKATLTAQALAAPLSTDLPVASDIPSIAPPTQTDVPGSGATIDPAILATQAFFTNQQTQAVSGQSVATTAPIEQAAAQVDVQPMMLTVYAQGSVNVRACPHKDCTAIGYMTDGQSVGVDGSTSGDEVRAGDAIWYQVSYAGKVGYIYSEFVTQDQPTVPPAYVPPVAAQPVSANGGGQPPTAQPYPENCSTAVAMGLSAQQAAQYPNLDADGDGVACYGS